MIEYRSTNIGKIHILYYLGGGFKMFLPGFIFRAIWSVLSFILRFTGRLLAIILGAIFIVIGVIFTISIAGAIFGIPLIIFGVLLIIRGLF